MFSLILKRSIKISLNLTGFQITFEVNYRNDSLNFTQILINLEVPIKMNFNLIGVIIGFELLY